MNANPVAQPKAKKYDPHARKLPAKCDCGNWAVRLKFNQPVCQRCLDIEVALDDYHEMMSGKPEPDNGCTMGVYAVPGLKINDMP